MLVVEESGAPATVVEEDAEMAADSSSAADGSSYDSISAYSSSTGACAGIVRGFEGVVEEEEGVAREDSFLSSSSIRTGFRQRRGRGMQT